MEGGLALFVPVVVAVVLVFRFGLRAVAPPSGPAGRRAGAGGADGLRRGGDPQLQRLRDAHPGQCGDRDGALCPVVRRRARARVGPGRGTAGPRARRLGSIRPAAAEAWPRSSGPSSAVALGLALAGEGWTDAPGPAIPASRLRPRRRPATRPSARRRSTALEAAVRLVPGYARLQAELAHAHLTILERRMEELAESGPGTAGGRTRVDPGPGSAWRRPSRQRLHSVALGAGAAASLAVARCLSPEGRGPPGDRRTRGRVRGGRAARGLSGAGQVPRPRRS